VKILVAGGAGYIGSHTIAELLKQKYEVVVFDNLENGHKEAIPCVKLYKGDLRTDKKLLDEAFEKEKPKAVIHFAGYTAAGESMKIPAQYFENNLISGLNLLEAMKNHGVDKIVFSSTCAIYGFPEKLPVSEEETKKPVSPYGESKLIFEKILFWYDQIFGIKNVCLRYFNAAGAFLDGSIGEDKEPSTNIMPVVMKVALARLDSRNARQGQTEKFTLFGQDYKTPDGTCIRDYIHVLDLASAHVKAIEYLKKENKSNYFNIGTGKGYSNKEVLEMVKKVSGVDFKVEMGPRRPGDPDMIYADNSKARKTLGWKPKYSDLETIVKTAWNWHKNHPHGFS